MENIRKVFMEDLIRLTGEAFGVHVTLQHGREVLRVHTAHIPNMPFIIGVPDGEGRLKRIVHFTQTNEAIQSLLDANPNLVLEPFLGSLVQLWNNFLCDLFAQAVRVSLAKPGTYALPVLDLRLDAFEELTEGNLGSSIVAAARKRFDDAVSVKKKARDVAKILGVDLRPVENQLRRLADNIVVRNVLQHNHGILRQRDLEEAGADHIDFDEGDAIRPLRLGDRVFRSVYDINEFAHAMGDVAKTLVPVT